MSSRLYVLRRPAGAIVAVHTVRKELDLLLFTLPGPLELVILDLDDAGLVIAERVLVTIGPPE